ncbi:1-acyl-sn-glycerol-3-phosphate acyltransferase gamma-like [Oppia nitens]|uniref:1-acyl-sn-glycerol-3-phosphate acyltransferase gamma-like n=1 Tax=Oppia nitens TaxID=1686743 RepID=UPI0023DCBB4D|nr:1-acyl-sn-glycerol-3-phosphate acyltransferase gamma-like [Oppia nitens]
MGFSAFIIFISSLCVNLLQLINYLTIRFINIDIYRQINGYLQYIIYSQVVAVAEWWSHSTITFYFGDQQTLDQFGREHAFVVANHRYEVDAVFLWMIAAKTGTLGGCKAFGKRELRFVPIIGWSFMFGEYIFLARNWQRDSLNIGHGLDRLMAHQRPIMLMIAAEGTRFTEQKYRTSMKFAADKGLDVHYRHHLLPRVKGFAYSVKHLKQNYPNCAIYNLQLAFDETREVISISNLIKGIPMNGSVYLKRIPIADVPTDSDQQTADYLYKLYQEKDDAMDYYFQHKQFPGQKQLHKPSLIPLIVLWTNFVVFGLSLAYILFTVFTSGSVGTIIIASLLIITVFVGIYFAIRSARIAKASTYGTIEGKPHNNKKSDLKKNYLSKHLVNGNNDNILNNNHKEGKNQLG